MAAGMPAQRRRAPRPNSGRRHQREQLLRMRAHVCEPNVLGWGYEARPKFVENELDEVSAPQERVPAQVSISAMFSQASSSAMDHSAPCDNASRDAFLAIRDALNLNRGADGAQVNERTAQICPLDIRFSQPSVKFVFGSSGMEVSKVVPTIGIVKQDTTDMLACPFPPIRCIWWEPTDGRASGWFALDNRRLLALQQRTVQAEHPHQCLAEVIIVDRLPDPSLARQRNFCKDGNEVTVSDGCRWSWQEALAKVCEEKLEMSDDDSTAAGSSGNGSSLDPSPHHRAMGASMQGSPFTPISIEKALGLEPPTPKPQVLTSLEAALGLYPTLCSPTNNPFTAALPPLLPASAPSPVDEAWSSLQVALGMEEPSYQPPSPVANGMQTPCVMPDYAAAMELMNFVASSMALNQQTAANGLNTSAQPWSPPEDLPMAATSPQGSQVVELDMELAKAAPQVPVKTHLKAPYRRPTDDEIAARLQNITIKPSFVMKPVREEVAYEDKENAEPIATVKAEKTFRI